MDICSEHGDDIAYSGRYCPACSQIEELNIDHETEIDRIIEEQENK